jgi:hypothetical protein
MARASCFWIPSLLSLITGSCLLIGLPVNVNGLTLTMGKFLREGKETEYIPVVLVVMSTITFVCFY